MGAGRRAGGRTAALLCALALVLSGALSSAFTWSSQAAGTPAAVELPGEPLETLLDLGDLTKYAALKYCATKSFAANPDGVQVLYGQRQSTRFASSRVFVLRNAAGKHMMCDMFGRDRPSTLPAPHPTAARPAVLWSNGRQQWSCEGAVLKSFRMSQWFKVRYPVKAARVRYFVAGVPLPWLRTARHGNFVHLQSWIPGAPAGELLKVELQLLDAAGVPVIVTGIPAGPRALDNCGAGNVIIG